MQNQPPGGPPFQQPPYGHPQYPQYPPGYAPPGQPYPPGYGQFGPGYPGAKETNANAKLSMQLGLVGILCAFTAPLALAFGLKAKKEIAANPGRYSNEGSATVGTVLGGVFSVILGLAIVNAAVNPTRAKHEVASKPGLPDLQQPQAQPASKPVVTAAPKPQPPPTLKVPVATLLAEYKNNEIRGDGLYKGKWIETTGVVGDVKRDILNTLFITLGTGAEFEFQQVQCFFDDMHAAKAATLSKGEKVTVRGRVEGLMMNVLVKDCEFAE